MASFSIEVIEADNPLEVLDYAFIPDTAGPGQYRGGVSLSRTIRMLAHEGILQVRSDRKTHRPYGLYGGGPGTPSLNTIDGAELPAKLTMTIKRGQTYRHQLPGAGGHGNPLDRTLEAVAQDLRDGLVTPQGAARDYGVVATGNPPVIDPVATEALRARLRAERPPGPKVAWEPLHAAK